MDDVKSRWPVDRISLSPPSLPEFVDVLKKSLPENFREVEVSFEECPDLRGPPFNLAAPGLCGNPRNCDVGGPEYTDPNPDQTKRYDLQTVAQIMGMSPDQGLMIGSGAGPFYELDTNTEITCNVHYEKGNIDNKSIYAEVNDKGEVACEGIQSTAFGLLMNLFCCDGERGPLVHVKVKSRSGPLSFSQAIRSALSQQFGSRLISGGGVLTMKNASAKLHVVARTTDQPFVGEITTPWLRTFYTDEPLVGVTTFTTGEDPGLGLRQEHTHCYSPGGNAGGHFHFDLDATREIVEYEAWLNLSQVIYRIDQPGR